MLKFGNYKLPKQTAIFNIATATDCESRKLGLCNVNECCYALLDEKRYKNVLPYRQRQADFWDNNTAEKIADKLIKIIMFQNPRVCSIRFNESGDFKHQGDVEKMYKVAEILKKEIGVHSYVYTARKDLEYKIGNEFLTVNGSGFMLDNEFTVRPFNEPISKNGFDIVCKGDCKICNLCTRSHGLKILVRPHGTSKNKLSQKLLNK